MRSVILNVFARALALLGATHLAVAAETFTVSDERVDLHAAADRTSPVVCQAHRGEHLRILDRAGSWICVAPPARADVWVYAELVRDGVVSVPKVKVRAGPGITHRAIGELDKDAVVDVRSIDGDWLRIAPPNGVRVWLATDRSAGPVAAEAEPEPEGMQEPEGMPEPDVSPGPSAVVVPEPEPEPLAGEVAVASAASPVPAAPPAAATAAEPAAPAAPASPVVRVAVPAPAQPVPPVPPTAVSVPKPIAASTPVRPTASPASSRPSVQPSAPEPRKPVTVRPVQGPQVRHTGVLRPASGFKWLRPADYMLISEDVPGQHVLICYLEGDGSLLAAQVGKRVQVDGRVVQRQGIRHPIVHVDSVAPAGSGR